MAAKWWVFYVPADGWDDAEYRRKVKSGGSGWWTSNPQTKKGDYALIYAKKPVSAIVAIVRAKTDARYKVHKFGKVPWGCYITFEAVCDPPLPFSQMQADRELRKHWGAVRGNFQPPGGASPEISPLVLPLLSMRIPEVKEILEGQAATAASAKSRAMSPNKRKAEGGDQSVRLWRISMRMGSEGHSMWPTCRDRGLAAIRYGSLGKTDLSKFTPDERCPKWGTLAPAQAASIRLFAYEIKEGDLIFVKEGPLLVGKGRVSGAYFFDSTSSLCDPQGLAWQHQIRVQWERDFEPIQIKLGSEPRTVLEIKGERRQRLEAALGPIQTLDGSGVGSSNDAVLAAIEGRYYTREAMFRQRNRRLIEEKKRQSDGRCSACDVKLVERYAGLEKDCLVGHHVEPIGRRKKATKTTVDDIDLLCPNCHMVAHSQDKPLTVAQIRKMLAES